jgi:hypothetical protein
LNGETVAADYGIDPKFSSIQDSEYFGDGYARVGEIEAVKASAFHQFQSASISTSKIVQ